MGTCFLERKQEGRPGCCGRPRFGARGSIVNDILREFLLETHENLGQLDVDLVTLEKDPAERETLARVFRTLHTVKGTAGFLGLAKLQAVAHAGENLNVSAAITPKALCARETSGSRASDASSTALAFAKSRVVR